MTHSFLPNAEARRARMAPRAKIRWPGATPLVHAAVLALLAGTLVAQSSQDIANASIEELMKIKVYSASRHEQNAGEAPSAVTVITRDQIQKYGFRTLADVLRSVRGFFVKYDRNYSYLGARGFGRPGDYNTRILLLIDGHRINDNVYDQAPIGTEFPLDIDLIDRIEVVRGPVSSLYGANAFFGVISVFTRKPDTMAPVELASSAASFGTYNGRGTVSRRFHQAHVLVSGSFYGSRGPGKLFFPEFDSPATNFGFAVDADDDQAENLFADVTYRHFTLQSAYGTREKGIPTGSFGILFNDQRNRTTDTHGYVDLRWERTFASGWGLMARSSYDDYSYRGTYIYGAVDPAAGSITNLDFADGRWWTSEVQGTRTLWKRHKLTAGTEFRDNLRQNQSNFDVSPLATYVDSRRDSLALGTYLQDEITLVPALVLNLGIRHDSYYGQNGSTNPRAALVFTPRKQTAFKFIYGTAFRTPNAYELYFLSGTPGGLDLSPEKIRTFETVWEQGLSQHLRFSASGYLNKIDNLIEQVPISSAQGTYTFLNMGRADSKGIELELARSFPGGWEGTASYCLQQTTDGATQQRLSDSPEHMAKLNLSVPVFRKKLFAGLDSQYMSTRGTLAGSRVPGFTVVNLTLLGRRLTHHLDLSASVFNLFDKKDFDPAASEHRQDALQQDGRNIRVKLTWKSGE